MTSREFAARWPFTCACCGVQQPEGTIAQFGPDGCLRSVEVDHNQGEGYTAQMETRDGSSKAPEVMPRGKTAADRCNSCFMIHATGQEECY